MALPCLLFIGILPIFDYNSFDGDVSFVQYDSMIQSCDLICFFNKHRLHRKVLIYQQGEVNATPWCYRSKKKCRLHWKITIIQFFNHLSVQFEFVQSPCRCHPCPFKYKDDFKFLRQNNQDKKKIITQNTSWKDGAYNGRMIYWSSNGEN